MDSLRKIFSQARSGKEGKCFSFRAFDICKMRNKNLNNKLGLRNNDGKYISSAFANVKFAGQGRE